MSSLHAWLAQDTVFQSWLSSVRRDCLPSSSFLVTLSSLDSFKVFLAFGHLYSSQVCSVGVSMSLGNSLESLENLIIPTVLFF